MVFLSLHLRGTKNRQFGQKEQSANRVDKRILST